jgi:hypothetical protein
MRHRIRSWSSGVFARIRFFPPVPTPVATPLVALLGLL